MRIDKLAKQQYTIQLFIDIKDNIKMIKYANYPENILFIDSKWDLIATAPKLYHKVKWLTFFRYNMTTSTKNTEMYQLELNHKVGQIETTYRRDSHELEKQNKYSSYDILRIIQNISGMEMFHLNAVMFYYKEKLYTFGKFDPYHTKLRAILRDIAKKIDEG